MPLFTVLAREVEQLQWKEEARLEKLRDSATTWAEKLASWEAKGDVGKDVRASPANQPSPPPAASSAAPPPSVRSARLAAGFFRRRAFLAAA